MSTQELHSITVAPNWPAIKSEAERRMQQVDSMPPDVEPDANGHTWDGPACILGSGEFHTCSLCGCDPSDDAAGVPCTGLEAH